MIRTALIALAVLATSFAHGADAPVPHWIWSAATASANQQVGFRKTITLAAVPASARLTVTGDNHAVAWVNGEKVLQTDDWKEPGVAEVARYLKPGANVIAILGRNDDGSAALIARLQIKGGDTVVTDASWRHGDPAKDGWQAPSFDDSAWKPSFDVGALGKDPWGDVFGGGAGGKGGPAGGVTAPDSLALLPGFKAELVYTVPKGEQGSWVSLTQDDKGRLIAADQGGAGLYRITPSPIGADAAATKVEKIELPISSAHGLLYAFNSLYVMVNGKGKGYSSGIYRLQDTDGDDKYDKITKLLDIAGEGEHGPHCLVLSPDKKAIYFTAGNYTHLPEGIETYFPPKIWAEDILLPRFDDPNGHAVGLLAPGGWTCRIDPEGKHLELWSIGYRNDYDIAFDQNGELFEWDSDMEWDMGTPWYRPIRVVHATSGSNFGWRAGSGNTPPHFADSLPPVVNVGPGSPTGATFGTGARFPAKYQRAFYILDWTYGTIYAIHPEAHGASFTAAKEDFISGRPLPVTDTVIGKDGAFYFTIGGRGTQSALYRVIYTGTESTAPVGALPPTDLALQRHKLEAFHGHKDPAAVATAWPFLGHADRFLRFAARTAIEHQPIAEWQDRVFAEAAPQARITALVALARCGDKSLQSSLQSKAFASLLALDLGKMDVDLLLESLRACSLLITRMGQPETATAQQLVARLDPLFPSLDIRLNRDLSALLAVLNSPTVVAKVIDQMGRDESLPPDHQLDELIQRNGGYGGAIAQMTASKPQLQRMHYALALSIVKDGWTPAQRQSYFAWFDTAAAESKGGHSFPGFIKNIRKAAWANVPESERAALTAESIKAAALRKPEPAAPLVQPKGPGKHWTLDELVPLVQGGLHQRSFENGRNMFASCQCMLCHRFAGDGGAVGPDISSVATRFSAHDLLESIVDPSKVISDQYVNYSITTKDGKTVIGRIIGDDGSKLSIAVNPLDPSFLTVVVKTDITEKTASKVSTMPVGLLDRLNQDEVLDLVAYLLSTANSKDAMFGK